MQIYFSRLQPELPADAWEDLRDRIPSNLRSRNDRFHFIEDRQRNLFGLLLVAKCWEDHVASTFDFNTIVYDNNRRPYLKGSELDFNISHSGQYVICTMSAEGRVGIDVEFKKAVDLEDFRNTMNDTQWSEIKCSPDPLDKFFQYWTIKESVIKADGRGLSVPLTDIVVEKNTVNYDGKVWYLYPFAIDHDHKCCLASDQVINTPQITEVQWQEFK
ncbi:MAG: 4'-phosphopantetheinyl transferase family protein [Cyclobacteriaceae bacterium]